MKNYTILQKYTEEIEISEIDFDLQEDIVEGQDVNDISVDYIVVDNKKARYSGESHPIKIDQLIAILGALKSGGANYAEIMFHCDHIGYVFNGVDVKLAGDDDVAENKKLIDAKKAEIKQREIDALERKLSQLKG